MGKKRSWTDERLVNAVKSSYSYQSVIYKLGLVPAGGNYSQIQQRINTLDLNVKHFTGKEWNKGIRYRTSARRSLESLLVLGAEVQSYKLKKRLYESGLKCRCANYAAGLK